MYKNNLTAFIVYSFSVNIPGAKYFLSIEIQSIFLKKFFFINNYLVNSLLLSVTVDNHHAVPEFQVLGVRVKNYELVEKCSSATC